jgi:hypothetical protein
MDVRIGLLCFGCTFHWKKWAKLLWSLECYYRSKKFEFVKFLLHGKVHIMDTLPNEPKVQSKVTQPR